MDSDSDPDFYNWGPEAQPELVEDGIKRLLLYCHRLVLDDPLIYAMDHLVQGESNDPERRARRRERLRAALVLLSYLRPLIDARVVTFVPQDRVGFAYRQVNAAAVEHVAGQGDFSQYMGGRFAGGRGEAVAGIRWQLAHQALESVRVTLALAEDFPEQFDFFFPDRFFVDAAARELRDRSPALGIAEHENQLLRTLLSVEVPDIAGLSLHDVIAVREDDTFVVWRSELRNAIHELDSIRARLDPAAERRRVMGEEMRAASARLTGGVGRSATMSSAQRGVVRLGIGAAMDALVKPTDFVGEAFKRVADVLADTVRCETKPADALVRHFALFE